MQLTYYDVWNEACYENFLNELCRLGEKNYLAFNQRIIFTKYEMIGIRTDTLRKIAKRISKSDIKSFLKCRYHGYYEELFIRGVLLSYMRDYQEFCSYLDDFIGLIDNWAICDMCISSYKIVKKYREDFLLKIQEYLNSSDEFIIRVGIIFLMDYYLIDEYIDQVFHFIEGITCRAYYVDMGLAWLISVCFVKYQDKTIAFLDNNHLDPEIIRMTVQKIMY